MFDLGWPELFVIAVIALIVIGPKELPRVMRTVGQWVRKAKSLTNEFRRHVDDMMRESELEDVRRDIEKASQTDPRSYVENTIDPNREIKDAFEFGDEPLRDYRAPDPYGGYDGTSGAPAPRPDEPSTPDTHPPAEGGDEPPAPDHEPERRPDAPKGSPT